MKTKIKTSQITGALLLTLLSASAFAQDSHTGGGNTVKDGTRTELADPFYAAKWEPFLISDEIKDEVLALKKMAKTMNLSFGDQFWDCEILNSAGCAGTPTEYRSVTQLPVEVVMKLKNLQGISDRRPFGYTSAKLSTSSKNESNITWIDNTMYSQLDLTDRALGLVHERMWAQFPDLTYEQLTFYTTTLRIFSDIVKGRKTYDSSVHQRLLETFAVIEALTGVRGRNFYPDYVYINNGKCLVFAPKIDGDLSWLSITDSNGIPITGIYIEKEPLQVFIDPENKVSFSFEAISDELPKLPIYTVKGHGNVIQSSADNGIGSWSINGSNNQVKDLASRKVSIVGDGNLITQSEIYGDGLMVKGNKNVILSATIHGDSVEYGLTPAVIGSDNSIIHSTSGDVFGDQNLICKSDFHNILRGSYNLFAGYKKNVPMLRNPSDMKINNRTKFKKGLDEHSCDTN